MWTLRVIRKALCELGMVALTFTGIQRLCGRCHFYVHYIVVFVFYHVFSPVVFDKFTIAHELRLFLTTKTINFDISN